MGRILVVDDHDSLRKGLVRALGNAGHDIEKRRTAPSRSSACRTCGSTSC
jgi:CheY-like chemotaxis protein